MGSRQEVATTSVTDSKIKVIASPQIITQVRRVVAENVPQDKMSSRATNTINKGHKAAVVLKPIGQKWYQGVVKWFRGSYGWIVCEEAATTFPGRENDIMLHRNDCDFKARQGDKVRFQLAKNGQGNPQAVKATSAPSIIDARDWFRSRAAERSSR